MFITIHRCQQIHIHMFRKLQSLSKLTIREQLTMWIFDVNTSISDSYRPAGRRSGKEYLFVREDSKNVWFRSSSLYPALRTWKRNVLLKCHENRLGSRWILKLLLTKHKRPLCGVINLLLRWIHHLEMLLIQFENKYICFFAFRKRSAELVKNQATLMLGFSGLSELLISLRIESFCCWKLIPGACIHLHY